MHGFVKSFQNIRNWVESTSKFQLALYMASLALDAPSIFTSFRNAIHESSMLCGFDMAANGSVDSGLTIEGAVGLGVIEKVGTNGFDIAFGVTVFLFTCTDAGTIAMGFGVY